MASTPLDDFLAGGRSTEQAERLERVGVLASVVGVTLAVGLLVFLVVVHRGRAREIHILLRFVAGAGVLAGAGSIVELAGVASLRDISWWEALTDQSGSAAMMRLLAGALLALGLVAVVVPATDSALATPAGAERADRWAPTAASAFGLAGAALGVLSFGFDGHTVTEGPRLVHAAVDAVHVVAGAAWFGGIVGLVVVAVLRRRDGGRIAPLVARFSTVATVALVAVAIAGAAMSLMIVDGIGDYTGTPWGRTLLVKLAGVAVAAALGGYHHFAVVPAIRRGASDGRLDAALDRRVRTTIVVEALVLAFVVVVTGFLVGASTS